MKLSIIPFKQALDDSIVVKWDQEGQFGITFPPVHKTSVLRTSREDLKWKNKVVISYQ